jgi:hypothetical protein
VGQLKRSKNKTALTAVIFIVAIMLGILLYQSRGFLRAESEDANTVFSFEAGQQYSFDALNGNIIALYNEGMTCISSNGKRPWSIIRNISNPRMQTSGKHTLVFDRGGKELYAYNAGSEMWSYLSDEPIITAKINTSGYAAVVSHEAGYKSKIEIIDNTGELLYQWLLSQNYIIDVDVSPDCKYFVAAALSPDNANVTSSIVVVDIDGERIMNESFLNDCLVVSIKYQKDGSVIALCQDELVGISSKGEKQWVVSFEGRQLQNYKLGYNTATVITFAGSRNNSILQVYGKNGQKTGEYISEDAIKDVDIYENTIAAAEAREIILLNQTGRVSIKSQLKKDIKKVILLSRHRIAVVGSGTVEIIKP